MSSTPGFAATPRAGSGLVPATLDTSLTAPTNTTTILSAGSSGSRIDEIRCVGVLTTVAAVVNYWLHDGSSYRLFDQVAVTAVTSSTTAPAFKDVRQYQNLILPSGWSFRVSVTVAGDQSGLCVTALGADF